MNMTEISLAAITRIAKRVDPSIRIGLDTKNELRQSVENYAAQIAEFAISIARNASRNTVLIQDIQTAREQLVKGIAFHQTQIS